MEIKITITDTASSVEQQTPVSSSIGYVSVVPATEQGAALTGTAGLTGINAGSAPAGGDTSIVPATEQGAALTGTAGLTGINAGSAPAGLAAVRSVGSVEETF